MPIKVAAPLCPKCGTPMAKRHRKSDGNPFWGCSRFPNCRGIVSVGQEAHHQDVPQRLQFKFPPSEYQAEIIKFALEGEGNAVVVANAGCAKTTTNMMVGNAVGDFLGVAFNTHIAAEWAEKQPQAKIKTTHSFGLATIRRVFPEVKIDDRKIDKIIQPSIDAQPLEDEDKKSLRHVVMQMVNLARATLSWDFDWLADRYGIPINGDEELVYAITKFALEQDMHMPKTVDFGDMLWLPHVLHLVPEKFPFILADEYQDFNNAQNELILSALAPGGRIIAVGDPNQSLYGFRGADVDGIPNAIKRLRATTFPLPVCYRCPKEVIKVAQMFVPSIEAAPGAKDGSVEFLSETEALKDVVAGDMILCRTNAPLVAPIYDLIRKGTKATIRGRDIGKGLIVLIEKFEPKSISLEETLSKLHRYAEREIGKLMSRDRANQAEAIADRVETIFALSEGCETVQGLKDKTASIFSDKVEGVVGSTIHRAKGLEADNVIIIRPDLMPHPMATKDWEVQQEQNCMYVAATRSKNRLVYAVKS